MTPPPPTSSESPLLRRRRSGIHGAGVFALAPIREGSRVIEYLGERITHAEADRRYDDRAYDDNHTFLFMVDERTVVDGGVSGNVARFINHSCAPNCEVEIVDERIFIGAIASISTGDELTYDYSLVRTPDDPSDIDEVYACRCGVSTCRGSMMAAKPQRKKAPKAKGGAEARAKPKGKTTSK